MKKYTKLGFFALTLGAFAFTFNLASPSKENKTSTYKEYIVELDQSTLLKGHDAVLKEQNSVLTHLRNTLGNSFILKDNYEYALNGFLVKGDENLGNILSLMPGVSSVKENVEYKFEDDTYEMSSLSSNTKAEHMDGNSDEDYVFADGQEVNYSAEMMNATETEAKGEGTLIAILDSSFAIDPSQAAKEYSYDGNEPFLASNDYMHSWFKDLDNSQVKYTKDEMYALVSDGSVNGAMKSGISYGEFGSTYLNNKIPFYYDYAGDSNHSYQNDYQVYSQYDEHGTHVASIAAANGDNYKGIAPNAQLALMKVFRETYTYSSGTLTASIGAYDSDILEALEDCVVIGVDALNMSLGSDLDDFTNRSSSMTAFSNLRAQGVTCSISAGNGGKGLYSSMGPYSYWTKDMIETGVLGSYANTEDGMIVASSELDQNYYESAIIVSYQDTDENGNKVDKTQPVAYKDQAKSSVSDSTTPDNLKLNYLISTYGTNEFEFAVIPNYGTTADYNTFSSEHNNYSFKGKIAVVDRGDISFANKAVYAAEAGCIGLVVVNNDPTATEFNFSMAWGDSDGYTWPTIPVVFALYSDRQYFQKAEDGIGTLTIAEKMIADNPNAGELSSYSSDGATYDLRISPEITAPGSSILGAVPGKSGTGGLYEPNTNAWAYLSGTSMSAPNYTGAAALMISEATKGMTESEKLAYKLSLSSRVMSTATPMATNNTDPITNKVTENSVYYSPRRQGAGLVNVKNALNSEVYLEGLTSNQDGTFSTTGTKKAKIELKYNDLVRDGNISLSFLAHNESNETKNYTATLYVQKPEVKKYWNYENHKNDTIDYSTGEVTEDPSNPSDHGEDYEYEGEEFQTNHDTLIAKKEFSLSIAPGDSTISSISYSLSDEEKEAIDSDFTNGTYLEGYVVLTPTNSEDTTLSIPYMGFYGSEEVDGETHSKYETASVIEDFDFERDKTRAHYPSDLVNYVGTGTTLNLTKMDISSTIVALSEDQYYSLDGSSDLLYNTGNIKNLGQTVAYDEKTNTIYAGGENSEYLYLQAFVLRSVSTNSVKIYDKNGKTVSTPGDDAFYDVINTSKYLFKSHVASSYVSSGVIAHRAKCIIPLFKQDDPKAKLPDGDYTLEMKFVTKGSSYTQTKTYNLKLDSKLPLSSSKEIVKDESGEEVLRLRYKEEYMTIQDTNGNTVIAINGGFIPFVLGKEDGYYTIDVKVSDIYALDDGQNIEGKVTVNITDASGNSIFDIFYLEREEDGRVTVESDDLAAGSEFRENNTDNELTSGIDFDRTYSLTFKDGNGYTIKLDSYYVILTLKNKDLENLKIYSGSEVNEDSEIKYEVCGNEQVRFKLTSQTFRVQATKKDEELVKYDGKVNSSNSTLGIVLGVIGGVVLLGVIAVLVLFFLKKRNKAKTPQTVEETPSESAEQTEETTQEKDDSKE